MIDVVVNVYFDPDDRYYIGQGAHDKGINTWAADLEDAELNAREAAALMIDLPIEDVTVTLAIIPKPDN